jgi:putative FmdB family regulatory protein
MPVYEYECESCHHRFELRQSFHDEPVKECPSCRGRVRKVFQAVSVFFRGSGWYVNDYGGRTNGSSDGTSTNGTSSEGASEKGASEAKPDKTGSSSAPASSEGTKASKE